MNPHIAKALACLQNAEYAGYFEEMDKVNIRLQYQTVYATNKWIFIAAGQAPWDFSQKLTTLAKEIDNSQINTPQADANTQLAYRLQNIYKLINSCYNDEALQMFCMFHFERVADNFALSMSRNQKIMALLDYAKRYMEMPRLLDLMQAEHPQQYEQHKPYF